MTSWFRFVSVFADSWAQIWFFLSTSDPTFQDTRSRQALLRAPVRVGTNKHVLPLPQPRQTSAMEFQNSMILRGKDILNKQRQLKKMLSKSKIILPFMFYERMPIRKNKTSLCIVIFHRNWTWLLIVQSKHAILTLKLRLSQLFRVIRNTPRGIFAKHTSLLYSLEILIQQN